jgi:F-type H+-transporting ATPase subunit b
MSRTLHAYALLGIAVVISASLCFAASLAHAASAQPSHVDPHGNPHGAVVDVSPANAPALGNPHSGATSGGHAEAVHAEHAAAAEHGPGDINWTDFSNKKQPPYAAVVINFALLMLLYFRAGKKPVADALKSRKEAIAKEIEEAAKQKKAAEERAKKYQANLANLDVDLASTKQAFEEAGKGERARLITEAKEKAERMKKEAAFLVDQEMRQAELDLTRETAGLALGHADKLLQIEVGESDHDRMVAEFIDELARKPGLPSRSSVGVGS